jgi:hypothetical protein
VYSDGVHLTQATIDSLNTTCNVSLNLSDQRVDASYASVIEQSGIFTGDCGYQVDIDGRTRLNGGAIA